MPVNCKKCYDKKRLKVSRIKTYQTSGGKLKRKSGFRKSKEIPCPYCT